MLALSSKVIAVLIGFKTSVNLLTFAKNSEFRISCLITLLLISSQWFDKTYSNAVYKRETELAVSYIDVHLVS